MASSHRILIGLLALSVTAVGCTHVQLQRSHNKHISTLTDIAYRQTLDNIAMIHCNPGALPHVSIVGAGQTQVSDTGRGSVGWTFVPGDYTRTALGLDGSRTLAESWTTAPVTDADKLKHLQCALRLMTKGYALEIAEFQKEVPVPDPLGVDGLKVTEWKTYYRVGLCSDTACHECLKELVDVGFLASPPKKDIAGNKLELKTFAAAEKYLAQLSEEMCCKLPTRWYGFSEKKFSIWKKHCHTGVYDGCCGKYIAWVDSCNVDALSRATLTLQKLAVLEDPSTPSMEVRRLVKIGGEELEYKATVAGSLDDAEADIQKFIDARPDPNKIGPEDAGGQRPQRFNFENLKSLPPREQKSTPAPFLQQFNTPIVVPSTGSAIQITP